VVGAGRVIYFPGGQIRLTFSWSLGVTSNNQAKAYAIFKGLSLAKSQGIDDISIIGDSWVIVNQVKKRSPPRDMKLKNIIVRELKEVEAFKSLQCYHVLLDQQCQG
jgi:ribonuclease HI